MKKTIYVFFLLLLMLLWLILTLINPSNTVVNIQVIEETSGNIIPVMVCITSLSDGSVLVPPFGAEVDSPSKTSIFYRGITYQSDKNWIGPVRKMNGIGDNDDRSSVYGLLPSLPYWKEPVMYQTSGDFSIEMSPGRYRISLEHGNEYIPIVEQFEISGKEKSITKTLRLVRWIDLPEKGWYSGDVHVHHPTNRPEYRSFLLEYAKAEDVHLVNTLEMGDHLGTEFPQEGFGETFRTCESTYCLVSGQEDPRSDYGHIVGLNIERMVRDTSTYHYYDLVFDKLHQQPGAIVGFAHFSWNGYLQGFPWYVTTESIDFIELLQFSKINTIDYYDYLNLGFRITAAAGSDIPWGSTLGEVRTFVYTGNPFSADAWFAGLQAGHTFVSNGPALFLTVDGQLPGTEIHRQKDSSVKLDVKTYSHPRIGIIDRLVIYNNNGTVASQSNPYHLDSIQIQKQHRISKSEWITAVVYCHNGAVAHSTPVYIMVDGQPTWDRDKAPPIIQKQLDAIQQFKGEILGQIPVDQGLLERIQAARKFYQQLQKQISNQQFP